MTKEVWISGVMNDYRIGNKLGLTTKYYDEEWDPPTHQLPVASKKTIDAARRHYRGITLDRSEFSEASYVFSWQHFRRVGDLFTLGPFIAVKGKLAELLLDMDLGEGGLIPYTIFEADKVTPINGEYYLVNFGAQKGSFLPHESKNIRPLFTMERHGVEEWSSHFDLEDGDFAVAASALEGADLWIEKTLRNGLYMSGRLVEAIQAAKIKVNFRLARCRIL